jgi:hypothetical protein
MAINILLEYAVARKEKEEKKTQVTLNIKNDTLKEIDELAKKLNLSRSQMVVNLLENGLDDTKILDSFGIFDVFMAGGKFARSMKEKFYKGQASLEDGELKMKL